MRYFKILSLFPIILAFLFSSFPLKAREVPFTQEDRDRLIRMEEGLKA